VRALLLDLDDTLLDYSGGVDDCWAAACEACCPPAGVDVQGLITALAQSRRWFWDDPDRHRRERVNMLRAWERIVAHALEALNVGADGLAAAVAAQFAARRWKVMRLFPEVLESLGALRRRGIPLALVTNGDASQQREKIRRYGLEGFFDAIVIEGEFGAGKPDEAVYRHALASLGVGDRDAWMAGDRLDWDVDAPQRLGLRGVWVDRAGSGLPAGSPVRPYLIVHSLRELTEPERLARPLLRGADRSHCEPEATGPQGGEAD
jgi:putative hydrolase of the HAD superfamily